MIRITDMRCRARLTMLFVVAILLSAGGCARPFPSHITERIDTSITYANLNKSPERYKGKWVMFGGIIVDSQTEKDGSTYLEIIQKPVDREGRPYNTDESGGRFMAVSNQFLDPAIYQRGRIITVVGEVAGQSVKPLDNIVYRYPLLTVEALHLWEPTYGPNYSVGIGVGVFHRF